MKRTYLIKTFFTSAFLLSIWSSAHSAIITLDYDFSDAALSGNFSYDDTTAEPLTGQLAGFTAYTPVSLNVVYAGSMTFSWTLSDYEPFGAPFTFLPTMDPFGTWKTSEISIAPVGWANSEFINAQGLTLTFMSCISNVTTPNSWCDNNIIIEDIDGSQLVQSAYTTSSPVVPIPAAIWLFGSGLIGLIGVARRKKS